MASKSEWDFVKIARPSRFAEAGIGMIRASLLFCSAAIVTALIAVPLLDRAPRAPVIHANVGDLDMISTGSIPREAARYTLRRSVLQSSPNAVCVIADSGARSGSC